MKAYKKYRNATRKSKRNASNDVRMLWKMLLERKTYVSRLMAKKKGNLQRDILAGNKLEEKTFWRLFKDSPYSENP